MKTAAADESHNWMISFMEVAATPDRPNHPIRSSFLGFAFSAFSQAFNSAFNRLPLT
jgi:hypothetical protein